MKSYFICYQNAQTKSLLLKFPENNYNSPNFSSPKPKGRCATCHYRLEAKISKHFATEILVVRFLCFCMASSCCDIDIKKMLLTSTVYILKGVQGMKNKT